MASPSASAKTELGPRADSSSQLTASSGQEVEKSSVLEPDLTHAIDETALANLLQRKEKTEQPDTESPALVVETTRPMAQAASLPTAAISALPPRYDTHEKRIAALDAGTNPMELARWLMENDYESARPNKRQRLETPGSSTDLAEPDSVTAQDQDAAAPEDGASQLVVVDKASAVHLQANNEPLEPEDEQSEGDEGNPAAADAEVIARQTPAFPRFKDLRFENIRNPRQRLLCLISVNNGGLFGSLNPDPTNWMIQLYLDAGRYASPTMKMFFRRNGPSSQGDGIVGWCLSDVLEDDWMLNDLAILRVADHPEDKRISHRDALSACQDDAEKQRLICISFRAWPKILLQCNEDQWKDPKPYIRKLLKAVFQGRHEYHIRIWFLAPAGDEEKFERCCLAFFVKAFETRRLPLAHWQDGSGVDFLDQFQERPPRTQ